MIRELSLRQGKQLQKLTTDLEKIVTNCFRREHLTYLKVKISDYIVDIVNYSHRLSKKEGADIISSTHVECAAEYLVSSRSRKIFRHLGTVGGILLGASLSGVIPLVTSDVRNPSQILFVLFLGLFGTFMIALHFAND